MKKLQLWILSALLLYFPANLSGAETSKLKILQPEDKSVVETGTISLVTKIEGKEIDAIMVSVNNHRPVIIHSNKREYLCYSGITLSFGLNTIGVLTMKGNEALSKSEIQVFYRSEISRENRAAPPLFKVYRFHFRENEKTCIPCHRMEVNKGDFAPTQPKDSICFTCHNRITSFKNIHGPASVWDCLACHNPETAPNKYNVQAPVRDVCFTCHYVQKEDWTQKKYWHGPAATGRCTICHNPHASDNPFWLRKPVWDLCTTCHEDKASGRHVIAAFAFGESHPTKGVQDPIRPGKELTCAGCHNPHAANTRSLFAFDVKNRFELCGKCHKK